ncbi:MAG: hypothetical protein QOK17_538 [Sphingomonadales bacterium]|jgi:tetratricopeptide (TPR) repeat protein|nr:hypothetical protein [Sphingomonadales bacterium]
MRAVLRRAIETRPDDAILHFRLANLELDQYDFAAAARLFEAALRRDPQMPNARPRLARCYNALLEYHKTLDLLTKADEPGPDYERGAAFYALGRLGEAEAEFRAVLRVDPDHREACRSLCKIVREAGRTAETLAICEALAACGVRHAQLLYDWGIALALSGEEDKARAILTDPRRVLTQSLPVPDGFSDLASFNDALAEELLANPHRLDALPANQANRGSSRVHSLFAGANPDIVRLLLRAIKALAAAYPCATSGGFDPWAKARPGCAHLRTWGLFQRNQDFEQWHLHPGGWLSGVYYVRVPEPVSAEGAGPGCIEFGPPGAIARAMPSFLPVARFQPREGMVLLAPSHYRHRTIPSLVDEDRISVAFDVVSDEAQSDRPRFSAQSDLRPAGPDIPLF